MKYCIRKKDGWGAGKDTIWRLDDELNYIDACYGIYDRRHLTYHLYRRENGNTYDMGVIYVGYTSIAPEQVKCKWDSQVRAIQEDKDKGLI